MVQNTSNMGEGNIYMSYFLGALSEIPCWAVPFIIAKMGRRWVLLTLLIISGVCSLVFGFIPMDLPLISLAISLIGRMTANGAFFICLQYSSEIFPTVIRGKGVALCEIVGGVAIFLSPIIIYLAKISPILPTLIFGLFSLLGAVATFFLPETAGKALPQTLKYALILFCSIFIVHLKGWRGVWGGTGLLGFHVDQENRGQRVS